MHLPSEPTFVWIIQTVVVVFTFLLNLVALLVIPRNRKPTAGLAWLLVIFLIPYLGWLLFLVLGTHKLPRNLRRSQNIVHAVIDNDVRRRGTELIHKIQPRFQSLAKLSTEMGEMPPLHGQITDYLTDYKMSIKHLTEDIKLATTYIYIEYYILILDDETSEFFQELVKAKNRGVEVRVLYDWWGIRKYKNARKTRKFLKKHAIATRAMLPISFSIKNYRRLDLRNHRKLVIIDDNIGYIGSQNIIKRNYSRKDDVIYDELVLRVSGEIVDEMKALFAHDWHMETREHLRHVLPNHKHENKGQLLQILPSGPSYEDSNSLKAFTLAINRAEKNVFIVTPYFVPPDTLLDAVTSAARRGVTIHMINSEAKDQWMVAHAQRSFYESLLKIGVKIHLYNKPILLHSKYMVIDNDLAIVGSSNFDVRSFELNQETSLIIYDKAVTQHLLKIGNHYLANSHRLTLEEWKKRSLYKQLFDSVARLTANLQ